MSARRAHQLIGHCQDRWRKFVWALRHGAASETAPIFIIGSQRSGTGMLGEVLGKSPEIENLGESDTRAFEKYFIKSDETVDELLSDCKCRFMVFKPLKDSERIRHFLSRYPAGRAFWAYRFYMDRINSAVREFGRHPLEVFDAYVNQNHVAWQLRGMDTQVERVVRSFNFHELTPHEGAALMWWVRNSLYFTLDLGSEPRIRMLSYDRFVRDPKRELGSLLQFIGAREFPYMLSEVHAESYRKDPPPSLRADIQELCQSLYDRLERALLSQATH